MREQRRDQIEPVGFAEAQVDEGDVEVLAAERVLGGFGRGGVADAVTGGLETHPQGRADVAFVVDDQDV